MKPWLMTCALLAASCKGNEPAKHEGPAAPKAAESKAAPSSPEVADLVVADLVVADLASNAFGNQKIDRSCVSVSPAAAAETSEVVAVRLVDEERCGDKTARGFTWIFVRPKGEASWKEEFLGPPPACWKGVPPELAQAIAKASAIPSC